MKRVFFLLLAALLIGLILTAIFYWLVGWDLGRSVGVGGSAVAGGLAAEALKSFGQKKKQDNAIGKMRK
jgi:hypothetical protein